MQQDTINRVIKKSELNAKDSFDLAKIECKEEGFLPVTYEEKEEEIIFIYDITGMKNVSNIDKERVQDRYRLLINLGRLEKTWRDYKFSLAPDNVYYDENFIPHIMNRDIYAEGNAGDNSKFLELYKTYVGGILGSKYDVVKLQQCGLEVLKKETTFVAFYGSESTEDLMGKLRERRDFVINKEKREKVSISKSRNIVKTVVSVVSPILLLAVSAFLIWVYYFRLTDSETVVMAMEAYVQSDYIECINYLEDLDIADMDKTTKYVLAVSYARTENLKKDEIAGIVSRLSVNSDERELEYWISLGRLDVENAEELSKALSDDKLLIYAYMKELNLLQQDMSKNGSEKQSRIQELEKEIKTLGDKYTKDEEVTQIEADEASPSDATGE